tara:strand:- start:429 stop:1205 length:777 start_codon:yes stop_codon:yes gene_type:complete
MKVVILAGGKGTRIAPNIPDYPKPLIRIGNFPIIWHIMKIYSSFNFNDFIICLGHRKEDFYDYFLNLKYYNSDIEIDYNNDQVNILNSKKPKWKVKLVDTGLNSLTGKRIKLVKKYINEENFLLTYGDGLSNINVKKTINQHNKDNNIVTLSAVNVDGRFGHIKKIKNKVVSFNEKEFKNNDTNYINGGFFVMSKKIFDIIPNRNVNFEKDVLPKIAKDKKLGAYVHKNFWCCMDTYSDYKYLNDLWKSNPSWKMWKN